MNKASGKFDRRRLAELIAVLVLLGVSLWMRAYKLDADPPIGLSFSTDVYTDPPQYTLFAKQHAETGDFNPYHDNRFVLFLKSSVTLLSLLAFKIFGVSTWSSNLVGLFFSFGALILSYLLVRKISGPLAGIFYLLIMGPAYYHIFYGRLPFLEHAMAFFGFLSIVLLLYWRNILGALLAGVSLAAAIFFSKIMGLIFLFPFACYFAYRFAFEDRARRYLPAAAFAAGFAAVVIFWLFFSYLPLKQQVEGYIGEQAFSLYGSPEGLRSLDYFVWKMVSFGDQSKLFGRIAPVALMAVGFIGMMLYQLGRAKSWKEGFEKFNSGHVFVAAMIIAFYGALMIWNYRPLRYQLILIYAFSAAASTMLSILWGRRRERMAEEIPFLFPLLLFPVLMIVMYKLYGFYVETMTGEFFYEEYRLSVAVMALTVTAVVALVVYLFKRGLLPAMPLPAKLTVVLAMFIGLVGGYYDYVAWYERPSFSARDNGRDLAMLLGPGAVISGPFAGELALENSCGVVIHMFGVSAPDPELFKKFPVTHLLLDQPNAEYAAQDYPELMDSATHFLTYHVGSQKVRLYRIAGHTGNPIADRYRPSIFEQMAAQYDEPNGKVDNRLSIQFLQQHPENMSGYLLLAEAAEKDGLYDFTEALLKKAVEFSPTNYNLNARLGKFYHDRYNYSAENRYKEQALYYYKQALIYLPTAAKVEANYNQLLRNQPSAPGEI